MKMTETYSHLDGDVFLALNPLYNFVCILPEKCPGQKFLVSPPPPKKEMPLPSMYLSNHSTAGRM